MEVFKNGIIINSWGVVYLGILKGWLTKKEVYAYCENGNILCANNRLVDLYVIEHDSINYFFNLIESFINEDNHPKVLVNNGLIEQNIPNVYYTFWEIEFLQRIINRNDNKEKALLEVDVIHSDFNYLESWHDFIYFMSPKEGENPCGIEKLYSNLLDYVNKKKNELKISVI